MSRYDLDFFAENLRRPHRGRDYVLGCCLYHDDTNPSLVVYERTQHFECMGCNSKGSLYKLGRDLGGSYGGGYGSVIDRTPWRERPAWNQGGLADYCLRSHKSLTELTQTQWYIQDRGLVDAIEPYGLGWDNGWYTIPVRNSDGHVKGAVARASPSVERKTSMRFDMPMGQSGLLYIPDHKLWNDEEIVYVTFGVFDAISLALCGLASSSPTTGKKSTHASWFDDVGKRIVVVPDRNEHVDANHLAAGLDWRGQVCHVEYEGLESDPNDLLVNRGRDGLREAIIGKNGG